MAEQFLRYGILMPRPSYGWICYKCAEKTGKMAISVKLSIGITPDCSIEIFLAHLLFTTYPTENHKIMKIGLANFEKRHLEYPNLNTSQGARLGL